VRYAVRAGGRDLAVEMTPEGRWLVGDTVVAADLLEVVPGHLWSAIVEGTAHEVAFLGGDRVSVDGDEVRLEIADERAVAAGHAGVRAGSAREEIRAPMPGLLKRLHVTEGGPVGAGDAVATLEAMKMENELRAGRDGIVAEIHGHEGMSVEAGALLIVIQ
jgi:3-methylcrotonyl-CoA carboxylase alpha subunit